MHELNGWRGLQYEVLQCYMQFYILETAYKNQCWVIYKNECSILTLLPQKSFNFAFKQY